MAQNTEGQLGELLAYNYAKSLGHKFMQLDGLVYNPFTDEFYAQEVKFKRPYINYKDNWKGSGIKRSQIESRMFLYEKLKIPTLVIMFDKSTAVKIDCNRSYRVTRYRAWLHELEKSGMYLDIINKNNKYPEKNRVYNFEAFIKEETTFILDPKYPNLETYVNECCKYPGTEQYTKVVGR